MTTVPHAHDDVHVFAPAKPAGPKRSWKLPNSTGPTKPPILPTELTSAMEHGASTAGCTAWCAAQNDEMPACVRMSAVASSATVCAASIGSWGAPAAESIRQPVSSRSAAEQAKTPHDTGKRRIAGLRSAHAATAGEVKTLAAAGSAPTTPTCHGLSVGDASRMSIGRKKRAMLVTAVTPIYCTAKSHVVGRRAVAASELPNEGTRLESLRGGLLTPFPSPCAPPPPLAEP
eukprot:397921-Prymnesium_polylepis.1